MDERRSLNGRGSVCMDVTTKNTQVIAVFAFLRFS
jgi:hypothetical protein